MPWPSWRKRSTSLTGLMRRVCCPNCCARGLLLFRQGDLGGALTALRASAGVAREQHALLQLGATLSALADVAQAADDPATALEADIERLAIIERIGPEVRSLIWAK